MVNHPNRKVAPKSFTLVVEESPRIELEIACPLASVPDLVTRNGEFFIQVAKYLSPGDRYRFQRAEPYSLV